MARPETGRTGPDPASWLARKIRHRNLRGLPPFPARGGGIIHQPEPYARLLLGALRCPGADARTSERLRDDARSFRSWVEGDQLELAPPRPSTPSRGDSPRA